MLDFSSPNVFAIIVAWLVSVSLGAYWYSPAGFGKLWSKLSGVNMMKMPVDVANKAIISVSLASVVQVVALWIIVNSLNAETWIEGLLIGLVVWAGFVAATTVGNNSYMRLGWKFWWLNASFFLVIMPINAILLSVWK